MNVRLVERSGPWKLARNGMVWGWQYLYQDLLHPLETPCLSIDHHLQLIFLLKTGIFQPDSSVRGYHPDPCFWRGNNAQREVQETRWMRTDGAMLLRHQPFINFQWPFPLNWRYLPFTRPFLGPPKTWRKKNKYSNVPGSWNSMKSPLISCGDLATRPGCIPRWSALPGGCIPLWRTPCPWV